LQTTDTVLPMLPASAGATAAKVLVCLFVSCNLLNSPLGGGARKMTASFFAPAVLAQVSSFGGRGAKITCDNNKQISYWLKRGRAMATWSRCCGSKTKNTAPQRLHQYSLFKVNSTKTSGAAFRPGFGSAVRAEEVWEVAVPRIPCFIIFFVCRVSDCGGYRLLWGQKK
jgi:hypothetical protein